jgi:hypothetical protein
MRTFSKWNARFVNYMTAQAALLLVNVRGAVAFLFD